MKGTGRKASWSRPLADWVDGCIAPTLARYGFGEVDIVTGWPDIVGTRLAALAEPVAVKWPRRGAEAPGARASATLVVRVEGPHAIEFQHHAPVLIERINTHLGWRCIGRIVLRQAPVQGRLPAASLAPPPPTPAALAKARDVAHGFADEALREALARLGARALKVR